MVTLVGDSVLLCFFIFVMFLLSSILFKIFYLFVSSLLIIHVLWIDYFGLSMKSLTS